MDPSPYLYDTSLYAMSGLMAISAIANYTLKNVDPKYFEKLEEKKEDNKNEDKKWLNKNYYNIYKLRIK